MRESLALGLGFLFGCSGATVSPTAPPSAPPSAIATAPAASSPTPARPPGALSKSPSTAATPSLVVENGFPIAQHLFVDWEPRGALAPGASLALALPAGTHSITCADSADADDNPVTLTEMFESGFAYRYRVAPSR